MIPWNKPPSKDDDDVFILVMCICVFLVWVIIWGLAP